MTAPTPRVSMPIAACAALVAVLFWSLKPIFITEIGGQASYVEVYLVAGGISVAFSLVVAALRPRLVLRALRDRHSLRGAGYAALSGFCLAVWYYGFYRALYASGKVDATIIAFSWPLISVFAIRSFAPEYGQRLNWTQMSLIWIAFFGAVAIGLANVTESGLTSGWEIVFAFLAALGAGCYLPFAFRGTAIFGTVLGSRLSGTFASISLANLVALCLVGAFTWAQGTTLLFWAFDARVVGLCVLIGIGTYLVAEMIWTWSFMEYQSLTLSSLAYFSPALSVVMLYLFYGEPVAALSVYGLMLILFANMTLHGSYQSSNAVISALIGTLYVALASALVDPVEGGRLTDLLYFISGLFAILAGFVLSRVSGRRAEELDQRSALIRAVLSAGSDAGETMDATLIGVIDIEFEPDLAAKEGRATDLRAAATRGLPADRAGAVLDAFDRWFTIHRDRLSLGEKVALWITGGTSIVFLVLTRPDGLVGQLGLFAFAAGCLLVIFTITDYERNNVHGFRRQLSRMQEGFAEIGRPGYVPTGLAATREWGRLGRGAAVRIRHDDGRLERIVLDGEGNRFGGLWWGTGVLLVGSLLLLPASIGGEAARGETGRIIRPEVLTTQVGQLFRPDAPDIAVARFDWDASHVIAEILALVMERRFGIDVAVRDVPVDAVFEQLAAPDGAVEIHSDFWSQNQPENVAAYISADGPVRLNVAPYPGVQGVYLPRAVSERYGIVALGDLASREAAAVFDADGDGLGEMWIGAAGWKSTPIMHARLTALGLGPFWELQAFSDQIFKAKLVSYQRRGLPIVFYGYEPDWVHSEFDLVRLAEPDADVPACTDADPADPVLCGFEAVDVHVAYAARIAEAHPQVAAFLDNVSFELDDLNDWLRQTSRLGRAAPDVARSWLELNAARVAAWGG